MALAEAAVTSACAHCGLPAIPAADGGPAFCCPGCRAAHALIHGVGLGGYYALDQRRDLAVTPSGRGYEEFDHATFDALYVRRRAGGISEVDLYLEGVRCAACVWLVERVPRAVPGCARAELQLHRGIVTVTWDPRSTPLSRIAQVLDQLGYRPHPHRGARRDGARRDEERSMLIRVGIAGALAGNVMMLALALYGGWFTGMDHEHVRFLRWVSLLLTVPIVLGPGSVFFRGAVAALRVRSLHMDVPVAIAIAAGLGRGAVNTISGTGPIYFDGVATLVFLLLVGRWLQVRAQRSAADASELMHALAPASARRIDFGANGTEVAREVPVEALLPGVVVEVKDGETMPADGTVWSGHSFADVSFLTGESRPVAVAPGDRVFAGAVNRGGLLRVHVEKTGEESRLGRILAEIGSGALRRSPFVRLADRLSGVFVAAVLALAAATITLWWSIDPGAAIDHGIALLIVTCPCALALATPLAVTVAIGRAARAGILIKGGDALEHLARPSRMLLDKTGTVTAGRARLVAWDGPDWVKPIVLALERHSSHPLAAGFSQAWSMIEPATVEAVRSVPGAGIEGVAGGRSVFVGAPWHVSRGPASDARGDHPTRTPVVVSVDGAVVARAAFADAVRPDAATSVDHLHRGGWTIELVSGDEPRTVAAVAAQVGIPPERTHGAASPEEKRALVDRRLKDGPAIMVGDGINDAPAMAIATVGIGVSGGAEACLATAHVHLGRPGLASLVELVEGSRRTMRVIRRNIAFSIAYNLLGAGLAMGGWMNPLLAAVLMPVSSLTVVLSSRWSRTFDEAAEPAGAPATGTVPDVATAEAGPWG